MSQHGPEALITYLEPGTPIILALKKLKEQCLQQEQHHSQVINRFFTSCKLNDTRQIPQRYPQPQLTPLIEQANYYNLTVNSSFTIIAHGIDSLLAHFNKMREIPQLTEHRALLIIAKTKQAIEKNIADYLRSHKKIEKFSQEERDKKALEQTLLTLETDIKTLSETERLLIEYYETVLKAIAVIKELAEFEKSLHSLEEQLSKLTPIEVTPLPSKKSWETSFAHGTFDNDALAAALADRLKLRTPDPAEWDSASLPGSKRNSLLQPVDPSVMNTALLVQYRQQDLSPVLPQVSETPTVPGINQNIDETVRPGL